MPLNAKSYDVNIVYELALLTNVFSVILPLLFFC